MSDLLPIQHHATREGYEFRFLIDRVTARDVPQLIQVHRFGRITSDADVTPRYAWARFTNAKYYDDWAAKLFDDSKIVLKATLNDTIVGFGVLGAADRGDGYDALWKRYPKLVEMHQLYVVAGYQRVGIGGRIFQQLAAEASDRHHDGMVINVLSGNDRALHFYQSVGARPSETIKETKASEPIDTSIEISCELLILPL